MISDVYNFSWPADELSYLLVEPARTGAGVEGVGVVRDS